MTAIWTRSEEDWQLLAPSGFPDEATLHSLVEDAPQLLPLAGSPSLIILGREVPLGNGYADLLAVELNGRPCIIEVKLSRNAEARRAVIAQILTYAAYLRGMSVEQLETDVLGAKLRAQGFASIADAIIANDQEGAYDPASFDEELVDSLRRGAFRLVIVLDSAPSELVQLVGYLEAVTGVLRIDLITVTSYELNGSQFLVPQRIDPERVATADDSKPLRTRSVSQGQTTDGPEEFIKSIEEAPEGEHPTLKRLVEWAQALESEGLAKLFTYHGVSGRWTLLPRLQPENVGLVTIYNDRKAYLTVYRSVFERLAPNSVAPIEALIAPDKIKQGNSIYEITEDLLTALTEAYHEAASEVPFSASESL